MVNKIFLFLLVSGTIQSLQSNKPHSDLITVIKFKFNQTWKSIGNTLLLFSPWLSKSIKKDRPNQKKREREGKSSLWKEESNNARNVMNKSKLQIKDAS